MSLFRNAQYHSSGARWEDLPPPGEIEIAFAGRSNSGKSSAINVLTSARLAHVSKTPGRTRLINFFRLPQGGYLVDLPGYGFAKVSQAMRDSWRRLIEAYLSRRSSLAGLVLIMDARHPLTPLDVQLLEWFSVRDSPVHVLLTKSDKLSRQAARTTLDLVRNRLGTYPAPLSVQLFSSLTRDGSREATTVLEEWMRKTKPPVKGEKTGG